MPRTKGALGEKTKLRLEMESMGVKVRSESPAEALARQLEEAKARIALDPAIIVRNVERRFVIARQQIERGIRGAGGGIIVTGAPGIGKSYNIIEQVRDSAKLTGKRFALIKARLSAAALYRLAYDYSAEGEIIILDDADDIIEGGDVSGMNLLKAMLDTTEPRVVSWLTARTADGGADDLPPSFEYRGFMIFISNIDWDAKIAADTKASPHMRAIRDRAHFLDMRLHLTREVIVWVHHIVKTTKYLRAFGVTEEVENEMLKWLEQNWSNLRESSLRTLLKMAAYYQADKSSWKYASLEMLTSTGANANLTGTVDL